MAPTKIPQPGPARLPKHAGPDEWLQEAKECKYLSEFHMKQLCEIVKEYMMEGELHIHLTHSAADLTHRHPQNRTYNPSLHPSQFVATYTGNSMTC